MMNSPYYFGPPVLGDPVYYFFTVGSRNSTKISNFKNKKMMTNELSSFDEFNGISSCLDNTIRFLSQLSKKCSTSVTPLTSEKLISTPDCEKIIIIIVHFLML
jgi:hypothetical protein